MFILGTRTSRASSVLVHSDTLSTGTPCLLGHLVNSDNLCLGHRVHSDTLHTQTTCVLGSCTLRHLCKVRRLVSGTSCKLRHLVYWDLVHSDTFVNSDDLCTGKSCKLRHLVDTLCTGTLYKTQTPCKLRQFVYWDLEHSDTL